VITVSHGSFVLASWYCVLMCTAAIQHGMSVKMVCCDEQSGDEEKDGNTEEEAR